MQNKMPEGVFSHPPLIIPIHQGTAANPGINQRALQLLFSEVRSKAADWDYAISVSAAEIYNEALRYREGGKTFWWGERSCWGAGIGGHHPMLLSSPSYQPCPGCTACSQGLGHWIWPCKDLFLIIFQCTPPLQSTLP